MGGSLWIVSMRRSEISRFNSKGRVIEKLSPDVVRKSAGESPHLTFLSRLTFIM